MTKLPPNPPSFIDKLQRADEHAYTLDAEVREFFRTNPTTIAVHPEPHRAKYSLRASNVMPTPTRFARLLADTLHSL